VRATLFPKVFRECPQTVFLMGRKRVERAGKGEGEGREKGKGREE
jgi:hypothetical protein